MKRRKERNPEVNGAALSAAPPSTMSQKDEGTIVLRNIITLVEKRPIAKAAPLKDGTHEIS